MLWKTTIYHSNQGVDDSKNTQLSQSNDSQMKSITCRRGIKGNWCCCWSNLLLLLPLTEILICWASKGRVEQRNHQYQHLCPKESSWACPPQYAKQLQMFLTQLITQLPKTSLETTFYIIQEWPRNLLCSNMQKKMKTGVKKRFDQLVLIYHSHSNTSWKACKYERIHVWNRREVEDEKDVNSMWMRS